VCDTNPDCCLACIDLGGDGRRGGQSAKVGQPYLIHRRKRERLEEGGHPEALF